ncbi:MAG: hypothetical protein ACC700_16535, partial [Anaerolineales bacterium]
MGHESPQLAHLDGWHPDFRDEIGGQEVGQAEHVEPISFHAGFRDPLDLWRMSNYRLSRQGCDLVIDLPGVGGGFQHDGVCGEQVSPGPGGPFLQGDAAGFEHDLLAEVDTTDDQIAFACHGGLGQGEGRGP